MTSKLNDVYTSYYGYNAEDSNPNTGLQYLRYRYYDTSDGRFNTRDSYLGSINNPLTLNRYDYTTNNPVNYIDPSGHYMVRNYSVMMSDGGGGIPTRVKPKPISNVGKSIINTYKSQSYSSKTILSNVNNKVKAIQSKSIGASATSVLGSRTSLLNNKYINGISIIAKVKRVSKYCTTNNTVNKEEQIETLKNIYGFNEDQSNLIYKASIIISKSSDKKKSIHEFSRIIAGLCTNYQGFIWYATADTPNLITSTNLLIKAGMSKSEVFELANIINSQHSNTNGLRNYSYPYSAEDYYNYSYTQYDEKALNGISVDFAHQMFTIATYANEDNKNMLRFVADFASVDWKRGGVYTNYVAGFLGDVMTNIDERDYYSDLDAINIYYKSIKSEKSFIEDILDYYNTDFVGETNREKMFLENIGGGNENDGLKELLYILNSETISSELLKKGEDNKIAQLTRFFELFFEGYEK